MKFPSPALANLERLQTVIEIEPLMSETSALLVDSCVVPGKNTLDWVKPAPGPH